MAWIETHDNLPDHPKVTHLAAELGIEQAAAVGHLVCLWLWCLKYADEGELTKYPPQVLANGAKWTGDAGRFMAALIDCGWLEVEGDSLTVHDWEEYAGKLMAQRAANRERARLSRERQRKEKGAVREACANGAGTSQPRHGATNLTNQTNQTKPKEEPPFSLDADAENRERLEAFRESLSKHCRRDLIWAAGQRNDPDMVKRTRDQVLALAGVHGWEVTTQAYQQAYEYKPAPSIAMLGNGAADWIAKNTKPPEERQKDQARTESPAGKIKARHDEARRLGLELLFTPKPGKCFVIEVADYNAVVMRPKNGGDAITAKGPEIARDFGKHLGDEFWTTEEPEEVMQ